jgi:hypothetical protein
MPRKIKVVEFEPSKPEEPEDLPPAIEKQPLTHEDKPQPDEIIVDFNHATIVLKIEKQQCNLCGMLLSAKTLKYSHDRNCKARRAAEKQPITRNIGKPIQESQSHVMNEPQPPVKMKKATIEAMKKQRIADMIASTLTRN